jgi:hypothetical protein
MTKYFAIILVSSLTIFSCNQSKITTHEIEIQEAKWDKITIETDRQIISIYSDRDTIISSTWVYKDSFVTSTENWKTPINREQRKVYLESINKDSIHSLVVDIITEPVFTDQSATCYAGNIRICVQLGNTELCCRYSSVGNWTTVSAKTRKLYDILKRKIE